MNDIDSVVKKIDYAFKNVKYPGGSKVLHPKCNTYSHSEIQYFVDKTRGKLIDNEINSNHSALYFFSPEAFQYYLPVFLKFALKYHGTDKIAVDTVIDRLKIESEFALSQVDPFTEDQVEAVKAFLNLRLALLEKEDHVTRENIEGALKSHWDKDYKLTVGVLTEQERLGRENYRNTSEFIQKSKLVAEEIDIAFSTVQYPGDNNIISSQPSPGVGGKYFIGKARDEITEDEVKINHDTLSSFTSEAFQYYLPVFLKFALKYHGTDEPAERAIIYGLRHDSDADLFKFDKLTNEQKDAIKSFLEFKMMSFREVDDIDNTSDILEVLWSYWDK